MSLGGFIRRETYWVKDYLNGSPVKSHFDDINKILNNQKYGNEKQKHHLNNIISHATKNSSFYMQFKKNSLEAFPIMNKKTVRENFNKIIVDIENIPGQKGNLHIQHTSGSTGIQLAVPQDTRKRNRRIAELKYFGEIAGFKSHEKLVQLKAGNWWLNKKSRIQFFRENIYFVNCSQINDEMLQGLCNFINKKKITVLYGYPNWFELFTDFLERKSIQIKSIKVVIAISEHLPPRTRNKLKILLNCEVVSRYSNEEQGILGQDRNNDEHFYLNHASYFFEFLKLDSDEKAEPGELSRIVVTDLFNYAFPMIRYDTGDTCVFKNINQSNGYPVLEKIFGRLTDLVFDTKGTPIHPFSFIFLKNIDVVIFWQFIQKDIKKYILKLKLSSDLDLSEIESQMKKIVGDDSEIKIEIVDDIPLLPSGKRKPVVCELNK